MARLDEPFFQSDRWVGPGVLPTASVAASGAPSGCGPRLLDYLVLAAAVAPAPQASRLALLLIDLHNIRLVNTMTHHRSRAGHQGPSTGTHCAEG